MKVRYRIDLNEPIQQAWRSSINGRAHSRPSQWIWSARFLTTGGSSFEPSHLMEVTKTQIS